MLFDSRTQSAAELIQFSMNTSAYTSAHEIGLYDPASQPSYNF